MEQKYYSITKDNFRTFLTSLSKDADVYIPVKKTGFLSYAKFDPKYKGEYTVDEVRSSEPIKGFLTRSRERVDELADKKEKQILVGIKNCDITSLAIQDFVFRDTDPKDPFYTQKRENTSIISCDCNLLRDGCFCTALEITPYAEKGFDLNLSKTGDGFVVEIGSEKGEALIGKDKTLFSKAADPQIKKRDADRASFKKDLAHKVDNEKTPHRDSIKGSVKKSFAVKEIWKDFASTCIECGGCNHCCPACHCFFLTDEMKGTLKARYKSWDACLYNRFARVAGNANPRRHLCERLRNRFDKKFEFFPNVLGQFGCTGCGRCIEACPGKIDIREVLKRVVEGK